MLTSYTSSFNYSHIHNKSLNQLYLKEDSRSTAQWLLVSWSDGWSSSGETQCGPVLKTLTRSNISVTIEIHYTIIINTLVVCALACVYISPNKKSTQDIIIIVRCQLHQSLWNTKYKKQINGILFAVELYYKR